MELTIELVKALVQPAAFLLVAWMTLGRQAKAMSQELNLFRDEHRIRQIESRKTLLASAISDFLVATEPEHYDFKTANDANDKVHRLQVLLDLRIPAEAHLNQKVNELLMMRFEGVAPADIDKLMRIHGQCVEAGRSVILNLTDHASEPPPRAPR